MTLSVARSLPPSRAAICKNDAGYAISRASHDRGRFLMDECSVPSGTKGAAAELRVAADLMMRGYHVFRALSPACPCDLIAYRDGEPPIRIEVKSGPNIAFGSDKNDVVAVAGGPEIRWYGDLP